MLSPYRINPDNTNKRVKKTSNTTFDNDLHRNSDVKRPQMTSNDPTQKKSKKNKKPNEKNKNILKAGSMHKNTEIDDQYLDEVLDINDI